MKPKSIISLLALLICCPLAAFSQEPEIDESDWGFSMGAFFTDQYMKTAFEVSIGDRDFIVDFDVFDLSQSSIVTITREIEWGDTVFPTNAQISTGLDLTIYKAAYTYNMLRREKYKLGVTGGLYVADIALHLNLLENDEEERGNVTAPLPVLGLRDFLIGIDYLRFSF